MKITAQSNDYAGKYKNIRNLTWHIIATLSMATCTAWNN